MVDDMSNGAKNWLSKVKHLLESNGFADTWIYRDSVISNSRLSLSRNRRDPQKQFEISVLRHIRFVVLRKKQFEQPIFTNDYLI